MADIRMRDVCKEFGDVKVIQHVDLDIEDGEFCVFVGPSGCGKSTLLRLVAGLEEISSGEMKIGGRVVNEVPPSKRGVSMVFQSYALYPHMTIFENMAFGLRLAKETPQEIDKRVKKAADILQMGHLLERLPKELSGGQRQRVAIGRSIVREPEVFLFDEPLSNLDAALRVQTRIEISKLHSSLDASMIYVTHDQVEAMTLADKIVLLNAGQAVMDEGSVAQFGAPLEMYHRPVNKFVAGFIGSPKMNFIKGRLESASDSIASVVITDGAKIKVSVNASSAPGNENVTIGIRPEHVVITDESSAMFKGDVQYVEKLGEGSFIYMTIPGGDDENLFIAREEGDTLARLGDQLPIALPAHFCHLFNASDKAYYRTIDESQLSKPKL